MYIYIFYVIMLERRKERKRRGGGEKEKFLPSLFLNTHTYIHTYNVTIAEKFRDIHPNRSG